MPARVTPCDGNDWRDEVLCRDRMPRNPVGLSLAFLYLAVAVLFSRPCRKYAMEMVVRYVAHLRRRERVAACRRMMR